MDDRFGVACGIGMMRKSGQVRKDGGSSVVCELGQPLADRVWATLTSSAPKGALERTGSRSIDVERGGRRRQRSSPGLGGR